jgi:hypothetical protein
MIGNRILYRGDTMQRFRLALCSVILLAMFAAVPASGHENSSVRQVTLAAPVSSEFRQFTVAHDHFTMHVYAYFGRVTTTTAYLDHLTFYVDNITPGTYAPGGPVDIWNSNKSLHYTADAGAAYANNHYYTLTVHQTFTGGYAGGHVAVTVEKVSYQCSLDCDSHRSVGTFYVP